MDKVEDGVWELKCAKYRLLYFLHRQTTVVLHCFRKKAWKIGGGHKDIALTRMKDVVASWDEHVAAL